MAKSDRYYHQLLEQELSKRSLSYTYVQRQIESADIKYLTRCLDSDWYHIGTSMGIEVFDLEKIKTSHSANLPEQIINLLDLLVNKEKTYEDFVIGLYIASNGRTSKVHSILEYLQSLAANSCDHKVATSPDRPKVSFAIEEDNQSAANDAQSETSGTASDDTITFLCGCDECTIDEFLDGTIGCKNPGKSKRFPLLNTSTISPDKQTTMVNQLNVDADEIDQEFGFVVFDVALSFQERNADLELMKLFLCSLEAVKARSTIETSRSTLIGNPFIEKINSASTITKLFITMAEFWSWFNYRLFDALVKKIGNKEEKEMMKGYENKLQAFLARHVFEMPSSVHSPDEIQGFIKFSVKLSEKLRSEKATEIPMIQSRFARLLEVDAHALILATIKNGCIELNFLVPEDLVQLFPLSDEAINEIRNMEWAICYVECAGYTQHIRTKSYEEPDIELAKNEIDDKHSVISDGSSGVTGSISTRTSATTHTHTVEDSGASDGGYNTTSEIGTIIETPGQPMSLQMETQRKGIFEVCQSCFHLDSTNERLLDNMCFNTDLHDGVYPLLCVAWDEQKRALVQIRPLPQLNMQRGFALCNEDWCKGEKCTYAHGELEKRAWNYELNRMKKLHISSNLQSVNRPLPVLLDVQHAVPVLVPYQPVHVMSSCFDPRQIMRFSVNRRDMYQTYNKWKGNFKDRLQRTRLNDEDVEIQLTIDNYQDKFYTLLCFEEMEHITLLTKKCDGYYEFVLLDGVPGWLTKLSYEKPRHIGCLTGISGDQLAYATQSSEGLVFVDRTNERDICRANILSFNFNTTKKELYISFSDNDVKELKSLLDDKRSGIFGVEFEVKHGFFNTLHKAIVNLPDYVIRKLMPKKEDFHPLRKLELKGKCGHECLQLNEHCQLAALSTIVSASSRIPVLVSGPFGCGKTRILARSAFEFIEDGLHYNRTTRVLICAHHPASTQTYITNYFSKVRTNDPKWKKVKIVRVTRGMFDRHSTYNEYFRNLASFRKEVQRGMYVKEKSLIVVTTYMTSMQLVYILKNTNFFTHILLDEAAQVREPEAVAPLCLATHDVKIVMAGDRKQVGPALEVLGNQAHENGLGVSLLERLEKHYKENGGLALSYVNEVKDNYRSNKSIVHFLSSIFYNQQISTQISVDVHPKTSFPFAFYCSDVDRVIRAPKEAAFEAEADAVLDKVKFYGKSCRWDFSEISIITPTRNQVNLIRKKLEGPFKKVKVLPTYLIQGHECKAAFLSTSEPLECDGSSKDPLKSLCNPFVFNTAISRAQSLVVAVGNPFMLLRIEQCAGHSHRPCWREYLKLCLQKNTVSVPKGGVLRTSVLTDLKASVQRNIQSRSPFLTQSPSLVSTPEATNEPAVAIVASSCSTTSLPKQLPKGSRTSEKMSYANVLKSGLKEAPKKSSLGASGNEHLIKNKLADADDDDINVSSESDGETDNHPDILNWLEK